MNTYNEPNAPSEAAPKEVCGDCGVGFATDEALQAHYANAHAVGP
jgi:hypothetical protein